MFVTRDILRMMVQEFLMCSSRPHFFIFLGITFFVLFWICFLMFFDLVFFDFFFEKLWFKFLIADSDLRFTEIVFGY